jgi:hypothetical protein
LGEKSEGGDSRGGSSGTRDGSGGGSGGRLFSSPESEPSATSDTRTGVSEKTLVRTPSNPQTQTPVRQATTSSQRPRPRLRHSSHHSTLSTHSFNQPYPGRYSQSHTADEQSLYETGIPSSPILDSGIVQTESGRETYLPDGGFFGGASEGADGYVGREEDGGADEDEDELEREARRVLGSSGAREREGSLKSGVARDAGRAY